MTVSMLLVNTFESAKRYYETYVEAKQWKMDYLALNLNNPVPADILIANSQIPKDIKNICLEMRLLPNEYELYGSKKGTFFAIIISFLTTINKIEAKIRLEVLNRLKHRKNGNYVVVTGITVRTDKSLYYLCISLKYFLFIANSTW
jgi:methylenetetrahydrofolate dehydrogenase (NADP+)/methenyltetrahydrofolate cyclohydrolase/formyltetrahydrofolate synthetase